MELSFKNIIHSTVFFLTENIKYVILTFHIGGDVGGTNKNNSK